MNKEIMDKINTAITKIELTVKSLEQVDELGEVMNMLSGFAPEETEEVTSDTDDEVIASQDFMNDVDYAIEKIGNGIDEIKSALKDLKRLK